MGSYQHGTTLATSALRDKHARAQQRIQELSAENAHLRAKVATLARASRIREETAAVRPPYYLTLTDEELHHRHGDHHGYARLLAADAEAATWTDRRRRTKTTRA